MRTRMSLSMKGTSLRDMVRRALAKADELAPARWSIEDADVWGEEDVESRENGMLVVFSVTFHLVADIEVGE